jgi:hypothetical protein
VSCLFSQFTLLNDEADVLAHILLRRVKQQRDLLLRKPNILTVKADIDVRNTVIVLIQDELAVGKFFLSVHDDYRLSYCIQIFYRGIA